MNRLSGGGVKSCGVSECEIEDDVKRRAVLRAVAQLSAWICTYPRLGEVADAFWHPENLGRRRISGALGHAALSLCERAPQPDHSRRRSFIGARGMGMSSVGIRRFRPLTQQ